jgi:oligopeptide/dipeptide ABC transporter ATP-binding protein
MVMYLGVIVEEGPVEQVLSVPKHPYTQALLAAVPRLKPRNEARTELTGDLAIANVPPAACPLLPRCPAAHDRCTQNPPMVELDGGHRAACWLLS